MGPIDSPEFLNKRKIVCSVLGLNLILTAGRHNCDGFLNFDYYLKFSSYVTNLAISKDSWLLLFRGVTVVDSMNYRKCSVRGICR